MNRFLFPFALATCIAAPIALAVSRVARAADPSHPATDRATDPATKPASSLDTQLLQGLDAKLRDGLDAPGATKSPAPKSPGNSSSDSKTPGKQSSPLVDPLDEQLSNSLTGGEDIGSPGDDSRNPLARIVVEMRQVQQRLAESKADSLTQREQRQISDELKSLIDQIAQQAQQQQGSRSESRKTSTTKPKQANPQAGKSPAGTADSPAQNSSTKPRPNHAEPPDPALARDAAIKELDRLHLPENDRLQMLQSPPDQFLPGHESSIEEYFKRLVEQEQEQP